MVSFDDIGTRYVRAAKRRHGYALGPGTLYPLLHGMAAAGYLVRKDRVGGKVRKYYRVTEAGRAALAEAQHKIRELVDEVLEGNGPAELPDGPSDDQAAPDEAWEHGYGARALDGGLPAWEAAGLPVERSGGRGDQA